MARWKSALLVAAAVAAVVGALQAAGIFEPFERKTLDARMRLLRDRSEFRDDVVFVRVGQYSLNWFRRQMKYGWPWPRDLWAYIIDYCREGGAKLVIFDIGFTEPSQIRGAGDRELAESMRAFGRLLQATPFTDNPEEEESAVPAEFVERNAVPVAGSPAAPSVEAIVLPIEPVWRAARRVVAPRTYPDPDGTNRRYALLVRRGDRCYASMGLAAAMEASGVRDLRAEPGAIRLGETRIPVDGDGRMLLLYDAGDLDVIRYEAADIIDSASRREQGKEPRFPPEVFRDKIVFVGAWAPGLLDLKVTPLSEAQPAVMIHATALSNILNRRFLTRPPMAGSLALLAVLVTAACFVTRFPSARTGAFASAGVLALYLAVAIVAFRSRLWLDAVSPAAGVVVAFGAVSAVNYLQEGRQRQRVKKTFQQYVSAAVVDKILKRPDALSMKGERKDLTILFLDFQGFTDMSERLDPETLVRLLDEYHNEAVEEIFRHEGTLDKFIGDAIMAFWNDPVAQSDHAARACLAAVGIRQRLRRLAAAMREQGMPEMRARIGINTGPAVAGNMGSKLQFNYTAMGDAVNLASRLEGVNKEFGTDIIVSEATLAGARDLLETRELALIAVKGRHAPVRIFEVLGRRGEVAAEALAAARRFEEGLAAFRARRWAEAAGLFDAPDRAGAVYAALCARYRASPPGEDWQGVYVMEHK